jgi:hypothetical protein
MGLLGNEAADYNTIGDCQMPIADCRLPSLFP